MFQSFSRFFLLVLLAVPAALSAGTGSVPASLAPSRVRRDIDSFNPSGLVSRALPLATPDAARSLTNAQRLARGLPPRSPRFGTRRRALAPRQSSTPCTLSPTTGVIRVTSAPEDGTSVVGYISRTPNSFGQYTVTASTDQALEIDIFPCHSYSEPFNIQATNGLSSYPYFGAVVGFSSASADLEAGSSNYAALAGTSSVPFGPAQPAPNAFNAATGLTRDVESAIWTLSGSTLVPVWANSDGTATHPKLLYSPAANAIALVGDKQAFTDNYGTATAVSLTFVPQP
ncbi:hypothetical protein BD414DRAFT_233499 [Trametes punicea]|nr:hypothetical protein BD414DRAFT_233499 [Trametes punicea]